MASFLGDLTKLIGSAAQIGQFVAPEVATFNPRLSSTINTISQSVLKAELVFQQPDSGPQKMAYVQTQFTMAMEIVRSIEAQYGRTISVPDKLLQDAIAAEVASKNAYAALQAALTVVPIPKS